jgi:hypothetical protein
MWKTPVPNPLTVGLYSCTSHLLPIILIITHHWGRQNLPYECSHPRNGFCPLSESYEPTSFSRKLSSNFRSSADSHFTFRYVLIWDVRFSQQSASRRLSPWMWYPSVWYVRTNFLRNLQPSHLPEDWNSRFLWHASTYLLKTAWCHIPEDHNLSIILSSHMEKQLTKHKYIRTE